MKRILMIFALLYVVGCAWAQQPRTQELNFLVTIDRDICQDIINGKFFIKGKDGASVDEMPFKAWVGKLEMTNDDYKKLFHIKPQDTLYITFKNNNFELHDDYVYEARIPTSMINPRYLILNIFNEKNEESKKTYIFPPNRGYVIRVLSPGYGTMLKLNKKE